MMRARKARNPIATMIKLRKRGRGERPEEGDVCHTVPPVKELAEVYWGNYYLHPTTGRPQFLTITDPDLAMLHRVDRALQRITTPGADGGSGQQDPEEFQTRLVEACLESVDHT
jgi:hypothetical protein